MGYTPEQKRLWRLSTGRTKTSIGPRQPPKTGTRTCYNSCHKRPEGAHPECREANNEYQRYWAKFNRPSRAILRQVREQLGDISTNS